MVDLAGIAILKATRRFAVETPWRSWWCLLSTVAVLGALLVLTALPLPWLLRTLFSLVLGLSLVRMFVIYHDYLHGAILSRSLVAKMIMVLYGMLVLSPPSCWKRSHNHHHKNNSRLLGSDVGSYPLMTRQGYAMAGRFERFQYRLSRHPLTILAGYFTIFLWGMCLRPFVWAPSKHLDCAAAILFQLVLVVTLLMFAPGFLLFSLLLPLSAASAMGAYLFYSQHNFPGVELRPRPHWDYVTAAIHSSSYTAMGPILRWFTGNIGYHHVHHLNARIPFYRLPEAMAAIPQLRSPKMIFLTPLSIYRCLRLNLWDSETNRLVSFRGK